MKNLIDIVILLWRRLMPLRFIIVGGWNTVFSYLVFSTLYYLWGGGWHDVPVQVATGILGITNAYIFHRLLTFRSHGVWWQEYLRFYIVYGSQAVLQMGCFFVFATWLGWNGYVVQLVLTGVFTVVSYWAHKIFSFKSKE